MAEPQDEPDGGAETAEPMPPKKAPARKQPAKAAGKAPARKPAAKKAPAKKAAAQPTTPAPAASVNGEAAREAAANAKSAVQQAKPVALPAQADDGVPRRALVIGLAAFAVAVLLIRTLLRRRTD